MRPDDALVDRVDAEVKRRHAKLLAGGEVAFTCPESAQHKNGDAHPSARWHREKAVWHCDVCGSGRGVVDLAQRLGIADAPGPRANGQRETARWTLRDADGRVVAFHVRLEPGKNGKPEGLRVAATRWSERAERPQGPHPAALQRRS